ncbi:translocase of outer membrane 20 isoform X2 [Nomia melanderi]|uniref:translocase of outer membrane 20 isoform X2 n=1 Tax=Nomia melanderi TaxID=2448451 RepID=UPI003FCC69CB
MTMISKTAMGIAVGIAGIFVGYCYYFDQKRRSDPDFKKKLRERRKAKKQSQRESQEYSRIPYLKDQEDVQRFFIHEVQLGEEKLTYGDVDGGIVHLANAVSVCGQPTQLLQVLQKTLPPQVFSLLLQRLPAVGQALSQQELYGVD